MTINLSSEPMLVNGVTSDSISIRDRGLLYGDGVFRTVCVRRGIAQHWALHYQKLHHDCISLVIPCPDFALLTAELELLLTQHRDAVFKIIVTRGVGARGYAPSSTAQTTHIWDVAPLPVYPKHYVALGIEARFCDLRLGCQPRLAGIKHLNRLENVMAAAEWQDANIPEGLLLDVEEHVIEGTRSNVFLVINQRLVTPDLSRCGVAGLQRDRILAHTPVEVRRVTVEALLRAEEVFLVNSLIGVWSIRALAGRRWDDFPVAKMMRDMLAKE
ncbi:MAG: aminodeoxychorismate lyase [Gallionella sp.]|nr:aminodeoxychorismate lyase [Gallionella sp.]